MCLGVPGRVVSWLERDPVLACAEVEFGGVRRPIQMACVPNARIDDYVIVHAGVAICVIDEADANRTLQDLAMLKDFEVRPEPSP